VPALYSPDWVAAFNAAVADLDATGVGAGTSLVAGSGSFRVAQLVRGAPGGDVRVTLTVDAGRVRMAVDRFGPDVTPVEPTPPADVTVSIDYADAAALSRGELDPADALGRGLVRVRGDLAVLVAGQELLAAAAGRLADLQALTTY
jgi:putative sterol carrier protein